MRLKLGESFDPGRFALRDCRADLGIVLLLVRKFGLGERLPAVVSVFDCCWFRLAKSRGRMFSWRLISFDGAKIGLLNELGLDSGCDMGISKWKSL